MIAARLAAWINFSSEQKKTIFAKSPRLPVNRGLFVVNPKPAVERTAR
jgi:hypothetical protein